MSCVPTMPWRFIYPDSEANFLALAGSVSLGWHWPNDVIDQARSRLQLMSSSIMPLTQNDMEMLQFSLERVRTISRFMLQHNVSPRSRYKGMAVPADFTMWPAGAKPFWNFSPQVQFVFFGPSFNVNGKVFRMGSLWASMFPTKTIGFAPCYRTCLYEIWLTKLYAQRKAMLVFA